MKYKSVSLHVDIKDGVDPDMLKAYLGYCRNVLGVRIEGVREEEI